MIEVPSLKELLDAGAHFGHKKERSYPKAKPFIYMLKDKINVINLEVTQKMLRAALEYLSKQAAEGKIVLLVGTKRQAADIIEKVGKQIGMPYVNFRWLGGMLTNFETIRKRLKYLQDLEERLEAGSEKLTKREKGKLEEEINKLHKIFDGIKEMVRVPDILFIVDVAKERIAVSEAGKMGISIVGITDTNANPELVDYPIPANDDAWKSIELIVGLVGKTIQEGKSRVKKIEPKEEPKKNEEVKG